MPRQARLDAPGTLHHIIIRGIEKRSIVDDQIDRQNFVERLGNVALSTKTTIFAWALMTNHSHILLKSGSQGLSSFMRKFLTGYAISYNRRHSRHGHLFQNRYKSIVCEEDSYFQELVRYIHLNPLRAKIVKDLSELDRYSWCGHSVIMGKKKNKWQERGYVLSWFGEKAVHAKSAYRKYVNEGVEEGNRPELVGGGLIRSQGGWSQVISARSRGDRELYDERILGSGDFVKEVLKEAGESIRMQFPVKKDEKELNEIIKKVCDEKNIKVLELRRGSRRKEVSIVRFQLAHDLVRKYGTPLAEVARQMGVSTSAISKMLRNK